MRKKVRIKEETWFQYYWRPAMAWQYFAVCLFDLMLAPIFITLYFKWTGQPYVAWVPLTSAAGGLYHIAMGTIIGVTSYTRGLEKIKRLSINNDSDQEETEYSSTENYDDRTSDIRN